MIRVETLHHFLVRLRRTTKQPRSTPQIQTVEIPPIWFSCGLILTTVQGNGEHDGMYPSAFSRYANILAFPYLAYDYHPASLYYSQLYFETPVNICLELRSEETEHRFIVNSYLDWSFTNLVLLMFWRRTSLHFRLRCVLSDSADLFLREESCYQHTGGYWCSVQRSVSSRSYFLLNKV